MLVAQSARGGAGMLKEFKEFALRGNVVDMAVGIIIGAAFSTIVKSLVDDIIMPPMGVVTGGVDFSNMFIPLNGEHYDSTCARATGRRADDQLRHLHQQRDQLCHRGLRLIHGGQGDEPAAPQARGRSGGRAAAVTRGAIAGGDQGRPGEALLDQRLSPRSCVDGRRASSTDAQAGSATQRPRHPDRTSPHAKPSFVLTEPR